MWVEPADLIRLLNPERTRLVRHMRGRDRILLSELAAEMNRTFHTLDRDLNILSEYQLVRILDEEDAEHGVHKVVEPMFGSQMIELKAEI